MENLIYFYDVVLLMIGWGELVLVIVAAIIFLGPEKLTEFARELGRLYGEYQKAKRKIELEVLYGYKSLTDEEILEDMKRKYRELEVEIQKLTDITSSSSHNSDRLPEKPVESSEDSSDTISTVKKEDEEAKAQEDPSR
jgi:Sec-independent protein translocase protein TatA